MKLVRWGAEGREKPGMIDATGVLRDLSGAVPDIAGAALLPEGLAKLAALDPKTLPAVPGTPRLGPPVGRVPNFLCIGLNYADHAAEAGIELPREPLMFMKSTGAICGPTDDLPVPQGSSKLDWEVELGIVIGKPGENIAPDRWQEHVAGYLACNDVSERAFQLEGTGQWMKGKSNRCFAPIGPWLVTADEVPDPQDLKLWLEVDGERMQDGSTATMVFSVAHLVPYVSKFMPLMTGDIIITGTPPGVGFGMKPPRFLKAGQVMRLGVEGLGEQRTKVVAR